MEAAGRNTRSRPGRLIIALRRCAHSRQRRGPRRMLTLRMLFNPMMLAHSALVTQVKFYDVQILKLAKGDETTRRLMTVPGVGSGIPQHDR